MCTRFQPGVLISLTSRKVLAIFDSYLDVVGAFRRLFLEISLTLKVRYTYWKRLVKNTRNIMIGTMTFGKIDFGFPLYLIQRKLIIKTRNFCLTFKMAVIRRSAI